jgi:hypothetical protein
MVVNVMRLGKDMIVLFFILSPGFVVRMAHQATVILTTICNQSFNVAPVEVVLYQRVLQQIVQLST